MRASSLLRAIFEDLPLKLVALAAAVTLFVIVRGDRDAATSAYVKVVYTLPADRVLVSDPIDEVRVAIRGSWARLQRFDERGVAPIRVDLRGGRDGEVRFDETMLRLPLGLRVSSITPPEAKIAFQPRITREVPVQALLDGEPGAGYRVARVVARPGRIRVEGAKNVVRALKRVPTRPLGIAGATGTIKGEVALEHAPPHAHFLEVERVQVEVEVRPAIVERTLEAVPVGVVGSARLEGVVEPAAVRVILRGPSDVVLKVPVERVGVSVDGRLEDARPPGSYKKRLMVSGLPAGVAAELQPDTVALSTQRRR